MPVRPLTPELAEKARLELGEDPDRIGADIQHLKDWIAKQPHLRCRTDDQWLAAFLRGCKYSLERAKTKIDLYYTLNTTAPQLTKCLKFGDNKFNEILDQGAALPMPMVNTTEPRVTIIRPGHLDPSKYSMYEIMCVFIMLQKIILMEDDSAVVAGMTTVIDLDRVNAGHFTQMTPTLMKKMVAHGQEASPFRIKGAHYLNTPTGFETIFNFMKNLLNEKIKKRLNVHKDYEAMYKHIPKENLPSDYGGTGPSVEEIKEYWKEKMLGYAEFFDEEERFGTDEKKRAGRPRTEEDMFGVDGSFRQLQLD